MKSFIKKIIVFLTLSLLIIIAIVLSSNYIVKTKANFNIDKSKTTLVLGHSHSECSINDSILQNTINLSSSGESYFYNYQKLKKIVGNNEQINTVFIEFANNHVDSVMDDWIWGYEKMSFYLKFYSPFMDVEDFNLLLEHNSTDLLASYSIATRKNIFRILGNDYDLADEVGGFAALDLSKVDELIAEKEFNSTISSSHSLSKDHLRYLRKMIDLCKANDIKIFLIRSPQHPLYADLANEDVYQNVLKTQLNDIDLLDFDAMYFPNKEYFDLHHLNITGANKFSTFFNNLIKQGLLNSENKQALINENINVFNNKN